MKDHKRFTERDDSLCTDCADIGFCRKTCIRQARYERLQFLENEIESGELVDRNSYLDYLLAAKDTSGLTDKEIEFFVKYNMRVREDTDKELASLTAENAALQARLEKAVELKAKVGDVIYMPWEYDGSDGVATLSIIGSDFHNDEFIYITDLESDSAYYLEKYKNGIFCDKDFDNIVFINRTAAEARLNELKGDII